jgi:hypothetical protein
MQNYNGVIKKSSQEPHVRKAHIFFQRRIKFIKLYGIRDSEGAMIEKNILTHVSMTKIF